MRLNMRILAKDLAGIVTSTRFASDRTRRPISGLRFYDQGVTLIPDFVFVVTPADMTRGLKSSGIANIVCLGDVPTDADYPVADIVCVSPEIELTTLSNMLSSAFVRYQAWEDDLRKVVDNLLPLKRFENLADRVFDNPCTFTSVSYQVLFCSDKKGTLAQFYSKSDRDGNVFLSSPEIGFYQSDDDYQDTYSTHGPTMYLNSNGHDEFNTLYENVFVNDQLLGRISIEDVIRPISEQDMALLDFFSAMVGLRLRAGAVNSLVAPTKFDQIVTDLLDGFIVPQQSLNRELALRGWNPDGCFLCLVITGRDMAAYNRMASEDCTGAHESYCLAHEGSMVLIVRSDETSGDQEKILANIEEVLATYRMRAGCSMPFNAFVSLGSYYSQASIACRAEDTAKDRPTISRFSEYEINFIISCILKDTSAQVFYPYGLVQLIRADAAEGTSLVEVLRTYLDTNCSIAETSRRLYLHRNTVLAYVKRIKEIIGSNLDDSDERFIFDVAFRLLDAQE